MRIKNEEWISFKKKFLSMLEVFGEELDDFDIPEDPENFELYLGDCIVHPTFLKKHEELRVQYDLSLCETKIRTIAFGIFKDAGRIEITLKNDVEIKDTF